MPRISAILLAAGESTRMGRQKALLPWEGTTLLQYQLTHLAALDEISEIIVVTGHEPERVREIASAADRARAVHNPDYRTGKVSSIRTGLAAISSDATAILLLAVDQPRPAALLRQAVEAYAARDALITLPAHHGHRGHPVIFSASLLDELLAIDEATLGIRAVLERHALNVLEVETSDPAALVDVNSPDDLPAA